MNDSDFIESVANLCQEWNEAENWVKKGERINQAPVIPAINELRYAGRRLVDAFVAYKKLKNSNETNNHEINNHIEAAKDNLNKARHDVVDSIFSFYSENAGRIREQIGAGEAQKRFPKYGELFSLIKYMGDKIENSRKDRNYRNGIYNQLFEELPKLKALYDEFEVCHAPIFDQIRKEKNNKVIYVAISIMGVVLGIVGLIF